MSGSQAVKESRSQGIRVKESEVQGVRGVQLTVAIIIDQSSICNTSFNYNIHISDCHLQIFQNRTIIIPWRNHHRPMLHWQKLYTKLIRNY